MALHPVLLDRVGYWRRYLRRESFDTSTPEGRSAERYRRIAWSALLAAIAKIIALATGLVSVPLVVGYLGAERYGMWATMSSLVAALGPLDLGIGLGLLTILAETDGRGDREKARRAVSTSLVMLMGIAVVAATVFALSYLVVPWPRIFNVLSPQATSEAGPAAAMLFASFALGLPLGVVGLIQLAYQSNYISSLWAIAGNLASLACILLVIHFQGSLPVLVIGLTGTGLLAALLNGLVLFRVQRPWLAPSLGSVDRRVARPLLRVGGLFMVLQLAGVAGYQLDNLVIAQIMGSREVQEYAIPARLFALPPALLSFALTPLWPAYREALARGDGRWVRRTLRRSLILAAFVNVPTGAVLIVGGPMFLSLWVGDAVHPSTILLVGLGIWLMMNTVNGPLAMLFNGANAIGFEAACAVAMAVVNVACSILLVQHVGVAGAVLGSVIAQALCIWLPSAWYLPRLLRRLPMGLPPSAPSSPSVSG